MVILIKKLTMVVLLSVIFNAINGITCPSFDCAKAKTPVEKLICNTPEIAQLDGIMAFVYYTINSDIKKNQRNWLKGRPNNVERLKEYYIQRTKEFLADSKNLDLVVGKGFKHIDSTNGEVADAHQPILILLGLIIEQHIKSNADMFKSLSEQGIETTQDFLIPVASACYKVADQKYLFKWCHGRGNHNSGYYLWLMSFDKGVFSVKLLNVQEYDDKTQVLNSKKDVTAHSIYYDAKIQTLVMTINCSEVNKFYGKKLLFKIDNDTLVLEKQYGTDDYKSFVEDVRSSSSVDS
jgi:hypothetical protein